MEILSYSHSRKRDLPVTHSSLLCAWLSIHSFFLYTKTTLLGHCYGFVGGEGKIAIVTALPLLIFVFIVFKYSVYGIYSSLFFVLAWNFGFRMWRLTRALGVLFLVPAEYSAVMCGAFPGT